MGENFYKFKTKAFVIRFLKSTISAVSLGCFLPGLLIFLHKLEIVGIAPLWCALIGLGSGLLLGTLTFLLLGESDIKLARRLDKVLGLRERVETMLEYADEQSAIHELQREDTNSHLSRIPSGLLKPRRLWIYIPALVISVAMLVFSLVYTVPPEEEPPESVEAFKITSLQIKATEELIASVSESEMASPYKENTVMILSDMLTSLKSIDNVKDKDSAVILAMEQILSEVDNSSSMVELIGVLWMIGEKPTCELAEVLNYYAWPSFDEWDRFESELADLKSAFLHAPQTSDDADMDKITSETAELLQITAAAVIQALVTSGTAQTDPVSVVLTRLASAAEENEDGTRIYGLYKLSELLLAAGYEAFEREIDATVLALSADIFSAISGHRVNTETGESAVKKIGSIFDVDPIKFERPSFVEISGGNQGGDEDNAGGTGGIGSGTEYGSDDLVLDPYTNTYVEYGVIIERYYALMFGTLQSGAYSEAEKEAMQKYFDILYGGFEKGEENTDE